MQKVIKLLILINKNQFKYTVYILIFLIDNCPLTKKILTNFNWIYHFFVRINVKKIKKISKRIEDTSCGSTHKKSVHFFIYFDIYFEAMSAQLNE
jgi:hypothetical protein